jgi:multiple sugar transport system ATP-binding protein
MEDQLMADVAFNEVDKIYDNGVQAVFDLTLDIHDGEFLVLVGPSGCGKTTALRMVAGLEEISDGTLSIGGRVVNDVSPKERDIAMVFQNYALYPHLSVAENIAFGLRLRKADKSLINERVAWAAKMLDLTPYLDRRPKELSGGQRQRVAMGRAIVRQPQVFLMDEPLSNLDAKLRVQMRADIAHLQRELGVTTIYVTHDQVEAMTMGDRVAVMSKGHLQQVDAPQRLYDRPENLFVAGFIGTPPMNLLEATASANGSVSIDLGGNKLAIADQALALYPRLREYDGRKVIVGLRAGDLHPAQGRDDLPQMSARVELVESLGGESMAYFRVDTRQIKAEEAEEEEVLASDSAETVVGARPNLVASFPAHVQLKLGDEVPIAVDTKNLHFFDEATGAPLR